MNIDHTLSESVQIHDDLNSLISVNNMKTENQKKQQEDCNIEDEEIERLI